ncbi:MAG: argininosuccinate synthase [Euryarchaeota archaeon]|nr:argininosuccinate synthase [Euryarchaeota archaeon]
MKTAVLAYSGGLDTSVCIPLLREQYGFERVVTVTVDVGVPPAEVRRAEARGRKLADRHVTVDARREFARDCCFRLIQANGSYEGYVIGTSIARALIARHVVRVARRMGANALAHGCTGKGNDQLRFEAVFRATGLRVVAPVRELNLVRSEEIAYARKHGIQAGADSRFSVDENLWNRSIEGGELEDPGVEVPEEAYAWTVSPGRAPARPRALDIGFRRGVPVSFATAGRRPLGDGGQPRGRSRPPEALIASLNRIAGAHGVGRSDLMEDRVLGYKARENYEHPAATVLLTAHRDLEGLVLTRHELRIKGLLEPLWAELVYAGLTLDPAYDALNAFIERTQERVTGTVRVRLHRGTCRVVARRSPHGLTSAAGSFETRDPGSLEGLLQLHGLQGRLARRRGG